jgi:hypothetical protein
MEMEIRFTDDDGAVYRTHASTRPDATDAKASGEQIRAVCASLSENMFRQIMELHPADA